MNFFNWKDAGSDGTPVRPFGSFVRRYLHFVVVEKADGNKITTPIPCINFDYLAPEVTPRFDNCPLDEVYEAQLIGSEHPDLPFVSFPLPPESWGKDAKIQRASFSASVNAINRTKQNGSSSSEESVEVVSFKRTAFDKILLIAGVGATSKGFAMGDPADEENGFDLLCMYHADKPGTQRYELQPARESSPLTEEEKTLTEDAVVLNDYYKILTRDEIIEKLTKIYDDSSFDSGGGGGKDFVEGATQKATQALSFKIIFTFLFMSSLGLFVF